MRGWISLVFFASILCQAQEKSLILITAFEPFAGRTANGSVLVANQLAKIYQTQENDIEISVCVLPVIYDKASEIAEKCYESLPRQPALVVSLGEADCDLLRLETVPHNLDDTPGFPDNAGQVRIQQPIIPGKPDLGFQFPVQKMFCSVSKYDRRQIRVSTSAGNFVCNNTAFRLLNYFAGKNVPYTFVHVQNVQCDNLNVERSAQILSEMLNSALKSNELARLPANLSELDQLLGSSVIKDSCEKDFFEKMKESY